jgi:asparagine synthase (glutamine-hydrolysing)
LDRHLYVDWKLTLADNDVPKVTRMTEAAGITVRYPFLDSPLVDFSTTIPTSIKMRGRRLRSFFKYAYADLLPLEIRQKQKHGFALPIPVWLRTDKRLHELMCDTLLGPRLFERGYFRKRGVENLIQAHATDETSFYGTALWNLMMLELWHRHHETAQTSYAQ